jgi:hypothetical protein
MKKTLLFIFLFVFNMQAADFSERPALVMIDPAGHAKNIGRRLVEGFERAETFKFAEKLQEELQKKYAVRPVLTRYPGEEIIDLQNASFANRLGVDFYLSLHVYREETVKPKMFMYHLVYNPMVDLARRTFDPIGFLPIHQAHFRNIHKTRSCANYMKNILTTLPYKRRFDFYGYYGLPIKSLCGVVAPAVAIEVGICEEDKWKTLVDPIVESLAFLGYN